MEKDILRTVDLSVGYGGASVVERIRLLAEPGKILTLIGPNGAGKTTILKTLIHQLPPVSGQIFLDGRDLTGLSDRQIARISAAVLTGRPEPELMTCEDVISAGRYPYTGRLGILSSADREKIEEAIALVGAENIRDRDFNEISDGQRQRVMLARAICQEPRLLILDEPTSYLDIRHKLDFLYLLKKLVFEKKMAVILSMHELDLAQKFSDRVVCIRAGAVDREGTPEEIFEGRYIESLYDVEHGSYDPLFGSIEPERMTAEPRVFVLGGGGAGIPVYRRLHRLGIPFAAGVLPENDVETPVARALTETVFTDRAFEPVSAAAVDQAMDVLTRCGYLINCLDSFGSVNRENRRLLDSAEREGKLLPAGEWERLREPEGVF